MSEKIVQLKEGVIKGQLRELVRGSIEETLNELLENEAEKLLKPLDMNAPSSAKVTVAATITATSLPLPEMLLSKCRSSKVSPLRLPSLSGIAAGKAA